MDSNPLARARGLTVVNEVNFPAPLEQAVSIREIVAAATGNALEWFDFVIYGYFARVIAKVFFRAAAPVGSVLMATATFVVRPLGSLILGLYCDCAGRKTALTLTVWLMMAGTALIAFVPSYQQAGWLGPAMLVSARMIQGLAASGEYGNTVTFLVGKAPAYRRCFYLSLQMSTSMLAIVLGGAVGTLLTSSLSRAQLESWGWRVPFAIGLLIGPVGYYIRKNVSETEVFTHASVLPAREVIKRLFGEHLTTILSALGVTMIGTVAFYLNLVYMPTFAVGQSAMPLSARFISTAIGGAVKVVMAPVSGLLSDTRVKPAALFSLAALALTFMAFPLYAWVIAWPLLQSLLIVQAIMAVPMGVISGLIPSLVTHAFLTEIRSNGLALSYNIPTTLFGGFTPLIIT